MEKERDINFILFQFFEFNLCCNIPSSGNFRALSGSTCQSMYVWLPLDWNVTMSRSEELIALLHLKEIEMI